MRYIPLIAMAAIPLAACTPNDTTWGGAVKHNVALQVIDPEPVYAGELMEGGSGQHAAKAVERYRKGEVKQPVSIQTTTRLSGGSSGRGSN